MINRDIRMTSKPQVYGRFPLALYRLAFYRKRQRLQHDDFLKLFLKYFGRKFPRLKRIVTIILCLDILAEGLRIN